MMDRFSKGSGSHQQNVPVAILPVGPMQHNPMTSGSSTAHKKSGKANNIGIGISGRNRTATALLVASASATSEPLQDFAYP
jgi:hypothetical protein